MLLGVDVGGTFTDAVLARDGRLVTAKAPSTPADQSEGVLNAVTAALGRAGGDAREVERFAHGMTVATNALLEGRGARTVLVATEGFTDVVELRRQARAELYRLCAAHPAPLVPPELRLPAPERMGPDGPLRALEAPDAARVCDAVAAAEPEAVAVALLHSYRHPEHERLLAAELARRLPGTHVSLSHEVVGTFREYERAATTEVDAALSPLLAGYLRRLVERAGEAGLPTPAIMQSTGGLAEVPLAAAHAALTVLSGPAGGAAGAAYVAARAGEPDALCFDMGGTSCDVCLIDGGRVRESPGREIGGRPLALPALDIHTVGAGGGSIAWRDAGRALRVGPRSAGADPGPAAYGRGGTEPTVTDANLVLGRLGAGELAGGVALDGAAAAAAVGRLAGELGLETRECAEGIVRVASAEMARALRVVSVERGVDPRDYALVAFGGAGPMHATAVADELGMERILCPPTSGVLAALGLVVSERRRDAQRSVLLSGAALSGEAVERTFAELAERARAALDEPGAALRAVYELRYRGQAFELPVEVAGEEAAEPGALAEAFAAAHRDRYGYVDAEGEVELVTVRVTATAPGPDVELARPPGAGESEPAGSRAAVFGGAEVETAVWRGTPAPGAELTGPAVCELPESTLVVDPGWRGTVDATGAIALRRA
ncbi:MAG: hydantoinase/oxoprolinase family protein [Actinobacteria bacterium]|nr:MAG: hydantoinase/oxoprolinase family protein [Actinomycetota bacterium]